MSSRLSRWLLVLVMLPLLAAGLTAVPASGSGGSAGGTTVFGACCFTNGDCLDATEVDCKGDLGGSYQGDDSNCVVVHCGPPTTLPTFGACCLPGGSCIDDTEADCLMDRNGSYQGDGTDCVSAECIATETSTTTTTMPVPPGCGDATMDGKISAADALLTLKAGVGSAACPLSRCDYNGSGAISAADALAILGVAVGQPIPPQCPPEEPVP